MDSIMNQAAVDKILASSRVWADGRRQDDQWLEGFAAALRQVERSAAPITWACFDDYDAEYPIMNRAAVTVITAELLGVYDFNAVVGNPNTDWLTGVAAGTQRFEIYAGAIVADCT